MRRSNTRTKCPKDFSPDVVVSVLRNLGVEMTPFIARCKAGGDLFAYNWSVEKEDRNAMYEARKVLHAFLLANPIGVFKKKIIEQGLEEWQKDPYLLNCMTQDRCVTFIADQAYNLKTMLMNVYNTRKTAVTGQRLPGWLLELVQLISVPLDADGHAQPALQEASTASDSDVPHGGAPSRCLQAEKLAFLSRPRRTNKRPLLKRVSSCPSTSQPDAELLAIEDAQPPESAQDDVMADEVPVLKNGEPFCWSVESSGEAYMRCEGCEIKASGKRVHSSGFLMFSWPCGHEWLSELPALADPELCKKPAGNMLLKKPAGPELLEEDADAELLEEPAGAELLEEPDGVEMLKKPASAELLKKPAGASPAYVKKLVGSRAYHRAVDAYRKRRKEQDLPVDEDTARNLGRKALRTAVAELQF